MPGQAHPSLRHCFNHSYTQKWHEILRLFHINHQSQVVHCLLKSLECYFCLLLSETRSSWSQWLSLLNSDVPNSQPVQKHTEKASGHNNSKPTLGSHVKCWNIFCVRENKFKAALNALRLPYSCSNYVSLKSWILSQSNKIYPSQTILWCKIRNKMHN